MKQVLSLCLLLVLTACPFWDTVQSTMRCDEPPDLDRLKETLTDYADHESKYLDPSNYQYNYGLNVYQAGRLRGSSETRRGASCPRHRHDRGGLHGGPHHVNERSLCPWSYTTHRDPDRIPEIITEVVCRCHKCLLSDTMRCKPIYYHIRALRRSPNCTVAENGRLVYQYYRVLEPIKVACACVSAFVRESSTSSPSHVGPRPDP